MSTFDGTFLDERITPLDVRNSVSVVVTAGGANRPSSADDGLFGEGGDDTLDGGGGDDTIDGGSGFDSIQGSAGDDAIDGGVDPDFLFGEFGNDTVAVGVGDFVDGGDDDDLMEVFGNAVSLVGGSGDDTLSAQAFQDLTTTIVAGIEALALDSFQLTLTALQLSGFDRIIADNGVTLGALQIALFGTMPNAVQVLELDELSVAGSSGDDVLTFTTTRGDPTAMSLIGFDGSDTLTAGAGADFLNGDGLTSLGEDVLSGGAGDDALILAANDTGFGGAGDDTIRYTGNSTAAVSLFDGGSGIDRLVLEGAATLAAATTIVSVEELALDAHLLTLTPTQLNAFERIVGEGGGLVGRVALSASGNISITVTALDQLEVTGTGSTDIMFLTMLDRADLLFEGGGGNDLVSVSGNSGADTLVGDAGADTLSAGDGADVLRGGEGDDVLSGEGGADLLQGGEGDDFLSVSDRDTVQSGDDDDRIALDDDEVLVAAVIQGGNGQDTLDTARGGPVVIAADTTIEGVETLELGNQEGLNERLTLTMAQLDGFERIVGDASFVAQTGRLILSAGGGASTSVEDFLALVVTGSAAEDFLTFDSAATDITVRAGEGNDTIVTDRGADLLDGGTGDDVLIGVDPFAAAGEGASDTLIGGIGNDTLFVTSGDTADGGKGDDVITLRDSVGASRLAGGGGVDTLIVLEASTLDPGVEIISIERLALTSSRLSLTVEQLALFQTIVQQVVNSSGLIELTTSGIAEIGVAELVTLSVIAADGDDDLDFTTSGDVATAIAVDAVDGNDTIATSIGDDDLFGGAGDDVLIARTGADLLVGGAGGDTLTGGGGDDLFRYDVANEGVDVITDFAAGDDRIEVSATGFGGGLLPPSSGGTLAADRLVVRAISNATSAAGEGQFIFNTNLSQLFWDSDGRGGAAEVALVELQGVTTLALSDLILLD